MTTSKTGTRVVHRSSKTGLFVTESYAKTHKPTTEREIVKVSPPSPPPPKGRR